MEYDYKTEHIEYENSSSDPLDDDNQDSVLLRRLLDSIKFGGGIVSEPVGNHNGIYFSCNDGYFYAITLKGELKWKFRVGDINGYPSIGNGVIYFGSFDGHLYALREDDGEFLWKFNTGDRVVGNPAVYSDKIYFTSMNGNIYCLDLDGLMLWSYKTKDTLFTTPAVVNNKVYFGGVDKNLYCLSTDGNLVWVFPTRGAIFSPTIIDSSGKELRSIGYLNEEVSVDSGYILFGSSDGTSYMLDLDGNIVWSKKTEKKLSIITVHEDTVYAGTHGNEFHAIELFTGYTKWKVSLNSPVTAKPIIKNNLIFLTSMENTVYAIDMKNKSIAWTFRTGGSLTSSVLVIDDVLFVGSWDSNIYSIDINTQELLWKFQTGIAPQKPKFFNLFNKFSDLRSKIRRFWRPDPKSENSIYKKDSGMHKENSNHAYSMDNPYTSKSTPYTMENEYTMNRKKKKDKPF